MKAVGYRQSLPITADEALLDLELPEPEPGAHDLLVEVKAISVNPVDTKTRLRTPPPAGEVKVLGWDVAGVVLKVGAAVQGFRPGDEVWYAGAIDRPGANAERHVVDERIAAKKPTSLSFAKAAALPLTAITAWELLFDRLGVARETRPAGAALLMIGAGGGVASILTQLPALLTGLTVIGTAGLPETRDWVLYLGAHHVIVHHKPLSEELQRIGFPQVEYVASLTHTPDYSAEIVKVLRAQGKFGLIDDSGALDVAQLKTKSLSLHWEYMFSRSLFHTPDMGAQGKILEEVARLVDAGVIRTTLTAHFGRITAENLKRAHALLESGRSRGKIVLEGF
jgi:zinc-binding alcohol dehydrogenase family protein